MLLKISKCPTNFLKWPQNIFCVTTRRKTPVSYYTPNEVSSILQKKMLNLFVKISIDQIIESNIIKNIEISMTTIWGIIFPLIVSDFRRFHQTYSSIQNFVFNFTDTNILRVRVHLSLIV